MVRSDVWTQVWEELEPHDLPGDLVEIALERTMSDARHLVEVAGKQRLYIPAQDAESNATLRRVARHLSPALYAYLRNEWCTYLLYVPTASSVLRCYRERYPERLRQYSAPQLARGWGLSVMEAEQLQAASN